MNNNNYSQIKCYFHISKGKGRLNKKPKKGLTPKETTYLPYVQGEGTKSAMSVLLLDQPLYKQINTQLRKGSR